MTIPFVDLAGQYQELRDEMMHAVDTVMTKANFILGNQVDEFENAFAEYCGAKYCVGVANGTDAIEMALRAHDIGPGDEVITSANTFMATAIAIAKVGAEAVFVDVAAVDANIDVNLIAEAVSPRTKAIIPVHLYGQTAEMDVLVEFANDNNLVLIEDAAQAHGAECGELRAGSFGNAGCFSFYPGKNLGAYGDGGAVVTNDEKIAERLRMIRNYGQRQKNVFEELGYNCRLDTMQAAILQVKLPHLERWTEARRSRAKEYNQLLASSGLVLPTELAERRHVYHLYVVQHPERDALISHLQSRDIQVGIHYPTPVPHTPPFAGSKCVPAELPIATALAKRILSLPMCPQLTTEQVKVVAGAVCEYTGGVVGELTPVNGVASNGAANNAAASPELSSEATS